MGNDFNYELYQQNQSIYGALGLAISNFAAVEFGLLSLYDQVSGVTQQESHAAFWTNRSTRDQLREVNKMLRKHLQCGDLFDQWVALKPSITECIKDRDGLAHGEVIVLSRRPDHKEAFFSPRFQKNMYEATGTTVDDWKPKESHTEQELIALAMKFWMAARAIDSIWDGLALQSTS